LDPTHVVVDTNILFSSLLHQQVRHRQLLLTDTSRTFYSPRFVMVEIFKHKERIVAASELDEEELLECLNALLSHVTFVEEGLIPIGTWMEGRRLCADVDVKDAPFVTLALHVNGLLWTADTALQTGLRSKSHDQFFAP
jgi:predicted nucleic acid-binding protein